MQTHQQPAFSFAGTKGASLAFDEKDIERALKVAYSCQAAAIERCDAYVAAIPNLHLESGACGPRDVYVIVSSSEPDLQFAHMDDANVAWVEFSLGHQVSGYTQETLENALRVLRAMRSTAPTLH